MKAIDIIKTLEKSTKVILRMRMYGQRFETSVYADEVMLKCENEDYELMEVLNREVKTMMAHAEDVVMIDLK